MKNLYATLKPATQHPASNRFYIALLRMPALKLLLILALLVGGRSLGWGQVNITDNSAKSEPFTGYTGTSTYPTNWDMLGSGSSYGFRGTAQTTGTSGGWYGNNNMSFLGSANASNGNATWKLRNTSGVNLTSFTLSFTGMLWKTGTASPVVRVYYLVSSSATFPASGNSGWTEITSCAFSDATANITTGATLSSGTVTVTVTNNDYIYLRWIHPGGSSSDNLGWDGITFTPTLAPANSSLSDIITNTSFDHPSNINYTSYQGTAPLTTSNSIEVGKFDIRDGGASADADALATTLTALTLNVANPDNIRRIALFDGSTNVGEGAGGATATFSGLNLSAADGGSKTFSVRASFLSSVTDNQQFSFTVASATASAAGSGFASANAGAAVTSIAGDNNRIEVTASDLIFDTNPSTLSINTVMSPSPTILAVDGNGNTDLDFTGTVTLSTTGSFSGTATTSVAAVNGVATFSNLIFSAASTSITIAGTASGVNPSGNSPTFNVTDPQPEINLKQGVTSIATGGTYAFGSLTSGTSSSAVTFTIENIGSADLTLNGSPIVDKTGTNASEFTVDYLATSTPIAASGSTTFTVTFSPTNQGSKTATLSIANNDATGSENPYVIVLTGTGTASSTSDIIANGSFATPANIAYASYQAANITGESNDIEVARFTLRDGGASADADNLGTTLTALSFSLSNSANIQRVALYVDGAEVGTEQAGAATLTFSGLNIIASDGGTKDISVRVSFNTAVIDNQQFAFAVTSATASASGSAFAAANGGGGTSSIAGDNNRIEVTSTKLRFVQQPTDASKDAAMAPPVTVEAVDANNNRDLDHATAITITSSGALTGSPVIGSLTSGLATFSTLTHTASGNNLKLTAASGAFSTVESNTFNILVPILLSENFNYTSGTLLTANGWTAHSGAGTSAITVTSVNPINYPGYLSSGIGNQITLTTSGEDVNRTFASQNSGSVYASFIVNVTSSQTSGDYFFHLGETPVSGNIFQGKVFIKKDPNTTNFAFGVTRSTNNSAVYSGFNYTPGTTYLVVLKYVFNSGTTTDDLAVLFVNPALNSFEPTPLLVSTDNTVTDLTKADFVALRQGGSTASPALKLDGIRISNNWADIVGNPPAPTTFAVSGTGSYCQGSGGLPVGVANSEMGVTYTISPGGATIAGTGSAISFGNRTAGTYTVSGTNVTGTTTMSGSAVITENPLPVAPTEASVDVNNFCANSPGDITLTATGGSGTTLKWYTGSCGGTLVGTGTLLTIAKPTTTTTYYARWENGCGNSTCASIEVVVKPLPVAAGTINGTATVTQGNTGVDYLVGAITNADSYTWAYSVTGVTITGNNAATPSVSLAFDNTATSGNLTVKGVNSCGDGTISENYAITVNPQLDWCNLQWPQTGNIALGSTFMVFAQVFESGLTEAAGQGAGIQAWIGYSTTNSDPSGGGWTWVPASFNAQSNNNDEYQADLGAALSSAGTYYYASRFQLGSAPYVYGGTGGIWSTGTSGTLTVYINQLDWCNLQSPASGSIATGGTFNVYARVYESGVTSALGNQGSIQAWIGYSTSNTNPSTWTNWVPATYNLQITNNYEYTANIGTSLPAGTYYYASRFKFGPADYVYGGIGNNFWDASTSVSGELTVIAPPAAYSVTGGGSYCSGGSGVSVGLSGSESGVNYQLYNGASTVGSPVAGTGSELSFGNQTAVGTYTVKGTNGGGTTEMTGSATVSITPAPTADAGPVQAFPVVGNVHTFTGIEATNYNTISWKQTTISGPAGTFDDTDPLIPTFIPSNTGVNKFTITVEGTCGTATDFITLYVLGTDPVHWSGTIDNDWSDPMNWLELTVPTADIDAVIPAGLTNYPTIQAAAECQDITVEAGASLIDMGNNLTVHGKATFNHAAVSAGQWHLISSPVVGAVSGMFAGQYLRNYDPATGYKEITTLDVTLNEMEGYALWPVTDPNAAPYVSSTGTGFNSGSISKSLYTGSTYGWNLVGNPYPATINWDTAGWTKTNVAGAIYIENGATWASYNGTGVNGGSKYIAPTQGFFVKATPGSTASLGMTPAVQLHKKSATLLKKSQQDVPNLVRLEVSGNGYKDEAVVRFVAEATNEFDNDWDAYKFFGKVPEAAQLYTLGSIALSINSLPTVDVVPVGIHIGKEGNYTIAATEMNDLANVTLEDMQTGIFTDLSTGSYTFNALNGVFDQRFKLHFSMLSVEEAQKATAEIYSYQRTIYINIKDQQKGDIFVYNISGQLVKTIPSARGNNEIKVAVGGNYIVKVVGRDNTSVKKVWIQQ